MNTTFDTTSTNRLDTKTSELIFALRRNKVAINDSALTVNPDDSNTFQSCPLQEAFAFCLESRENNYIEVLKHGKIGDYYINNLVHYEDSFCPPLASAYTCISEALNCANELEYDSERITGISRNNDAMTIEFDDDVVSFDRITEGLSVTVNKSLTRRARKALKGMHREMDDNQIKRRLKGIEGFDGQSIRISLHKHPEDPNLFKRPLDLNLNNFVALFQNIINAFAVDPISLSQARVVFCDYYKIDNWHQIKHNEEALFIPVVVTEYEWDDDKNQVVSKKNTVVNSTASAYALTGKKMKAYDKRFNVSMYNDDFIATSGAYHIAIKPVNFHNAIHSNSEIIEDFDEMSEWDIDVFNEELLDNIKSIITTKS